jgi:hypothetical protein
MCALIGHNFDKEHIQALLFQLCNYSINDLPMRFPQFVDQVDVRHYVYIDVFLIYFH